MGMTVGGWKPMLTIKTAPAFFTSTGEPSPERTRVRGDSAKVVEQEIAGCTLALGEQGPIESVLKRFDAAILQHLRTEDSFADNIETIIGKAEMLLKKIANDPRVIDDLTEITDRQGDLSHLASLKDTWGMLVTNDPWHKLECLTKWVGRVATYTTIPSSKYKIRHPEATLVRAPNGYIPANRIGPDRVKDITGLPKLIAARYPYATGSDSAEMLLRIAYEGGGAILDLTQVRDVNAGDIYYPTEDGEVKSYRALVITHQKEEDGVQYYEIKDRASGSRTLKRFHFKEWPDGGALGDSEKLAQLARRIDAFCAQTVIVHCIGGLGRTGATLAAYFTLHRIRAGLITAGNLDQDVFDTVLYLREQRGPECVQTEGQYKELVAFARDRLDAQASAGSGSA